MSNGVSFDGATSKNTVDKMTSKIDTQTVVKEKVPTPVRGRGQSTDSTCGRGSRDEGDRGEDHDDGGDEGGSGGGHDMDPITVGKRGKIKVKKKILLTFFPLFSITHTLRCIGQHNVTRPMTQPARLMYPSVSDGVYEPAPSPSPCF